MSIIQIPSDLAIVRQDFGIRTFDLSFTNENTGAVQTSVFGPPRRTCSLVGNERAELESGASWRALIHSLRGRVNQLAVYDTIQTRPRGTARGAWVAQATAAAGAASIVIDLGEDQAGRTLKQGDWIGVNQLANYRQLLHVQADATADGSGLIGVSFEPVLRVAVAAGSVIVWDRPTCLMRRVSGDSTWGTHPSELQGGFSLDLMESWE